MSETATDPPDSIFVPETPRQAALRLFARETPFGIPAESRIEQAEAALAALHDEIDGWLRAAAAALAEARARWRRMPADPGRLAAVGAAAHDLRGMALQARYRTAADVAENLVRLIERIPPEETPAALVEQHVDAIRAMVDERVEGDGTPAAREITAWLVDAVDGVNELRDQAAIGAASSRGADGIATTAAAN